MAKQKKNLTKTSFQDISFQKIPNQKQANNHRKLAAQKYSPKIKQSSAPLKCQLSCYFSVKSAQYRLQSA